MLRLSPVVCGEWLYGSARKFHVCKLYPSSTTAAISLTVQGYVILLPYTHSISANCLTHFSRLHCCTLGIPVMLHRKGGQGMTSSTPPLFFALAAELQNQIWLDALPDDSQLVLVFLTRGRWEGAEPDLYFRVPSRTIGCCPLGIFPSHFRSQCSICGHGLVPRTAAA